MPEIGQTISPYHILEKLGQGGMGIVHRVHDPTVDRRVAVKVRPEAFAGEPERMARFEREAKLLALLNPKNTEAWAGAGPGQALPDAVEKRP